MKRGGESGKEEMRDGLWRVIEEALREEGLDLNALDAAVGGGLPKVKIVCVAPDLKTSAEDLAKSSRDQVVMVRVDDATLRTLDAWVETGAVKSRSEAAALFIREGLAVRRRELERLDGALQEFKQARQRLRDQARSVFGETETKE
jgi:hypothetical protein